METDFYLFRSQVLFSKLICLDEILNESFHTFILLRKLSYFELSIIGCNSRSIYSSILSLRGSIDLGNVVENDLPEHSVLSGIDESLNQCLYVRLRKDDSIILLTENVPELSFSDGSILTSAQKFFFQIHIPLHTFQINLLQNLSHEI
jgi:hypothetical protein